MSRASAARQAAYELTDAARDDALLEAARLYDAVGDRADYDVVTRAEALFRAGEILRARGRVAEAVQRFERVVELGESSEEPEARSFAARGLLELAHERRRAEDHETALELYAEVARRFPGQERQRAHAHTWTGKLLIALGRLDEALPHVAGFARAHPDYPLEAIRNVDQLAVALTEAGTDSAQVRELLTGLREDLAGVLAGGGAEADEVREALGSLRVTVSASGY